ncbi:MAG: hypothetical protein ACLR23_12890 [Clostridia bacterium]
MTYVYKGQPIIRTMENEDGNGDHEEIAPATFCNKRDTPDNTAAAR